MKRWSLILVSALMVVAVLSVAGCQSQGKALVVGTSADYEPFEYVDENGKYVGFDIELMEEVAARLDNAAAQNDSLRREGKNKIRHCVSERERLHLDHTRSISAEIFSGCAPSVRNRRTRREAFEAIPVEWAPPGKGVVGVPRDPEVADLRVDQSMDRFSVRHNSPADSSANGDVDEVIETGTGSPATFAEGSSVHVGVEADRDPERLAQRTDDIGIRPSRLRRGSNVPIVGRLPIDIERPEHCDSDGVERPATREKLDCLRERLFGGGGREPDLGPEIVRCAPDGTRELRAATFDASVQRHRARLDEWGGGRDTRHETRDTRSSTGLSVM